MMLLESGHKLGNDSTHDVENDLLSINYTIELTLLRQTRGSFNGYNQSSSGADQSK